ncbi:THUMP domain-containing protein 3 [Salvelinus fontinalis]|uniref:THUMP domain-containing protein 3 n=1 Tax=Salvelinus fontinalis TaxID=8038 RepID=UPI002485246F|nr:THUMP domain-containing protein 3 [Salvelinus fontinalis]
MSSQDSSEGQQCPLAVGVETSSQSASDGETDCAVITVTIGATVPTGFENTAAEEVQEKIGADATISKDRGRIYFQITTDKLSQVHNLRSVDNLFVVVEEYDNYQFKDSKEETLEDLQKLASKLAWTNALKVWKLNTSLKKKRGPHRRPQGPKGKGRRGRDFRDRGKANKDVVEMDTMETVTAEIEKLQLEPQAPTTGQGGWVGETGSPDLENSPLGEQQEVEGQEPGPKVLKFRVTCSRAGDKHSFSSNEAARDFGGAVQDFFQWKADMTKFDIEVLLNIHNVEVVIGIALTEESLHRRNITHFGPTTLRSTLCYGMLRLSKPQASDVILDPMCGTGAIPLEGAIEWQQAFYLAGDNNDMAVSRTVNNICHIQKKRLDKSSTPGLPIDTVQWDLCHLPMRTNSVDIIITDMPFGKRMGSRKNNWDLYPPCLREMARVSRPGSGKAVILTQDKKCFQKAISRMGGLWRKHHTVWVNVGGLHAGVFLLKRTAGIFGQTPEDVREPLEEQPGKEKTAEEREKEVK